MGPKALQYPQRTRIPPRTYRFHLSLRPTGETLYPSPHQLVKRPLFTSFQGLSVKGRQFLPIIPTILTGPSLPIHEYTYVNPYSYSPAHDRRQPDRMGWDTPPRFHIRGMVQETSQNVNKLARTINIPVISHSFSPSNKRKTFNDTIRHKCPSGLKVSSVTHRHRMVSRSGNFQYSLEHLWPLLYRSFRQQRKQYTEVPHFSIPRPFIFRGVRPFPPLGGLGLPVHISTSSSDGRSASTPTNVPGQRYTYSPILCSIKVVFTTSDQIPSTSSSSRRIFTVPDDMPEHNIPPRGVQTSRL